MPLNLLALSSWSAIDILLWFQNVFLTSFWINHIIIFIFMYIIAYYSIINGGILVYIFIGVLFYFREQQISIFILSLPSHYLSVFYFIMVIFGYKNSYHLVELTNSIIKMNMYVGRQYRRVKMHFPLIITEKLFHFYFYF